MFLQPSGPSPGLAHPCAWSMSLCTRESHVGAGAAPRQRLPSAAAHVAPSDCSVSEVIFLLLAEGYSYIGSTNFKKNFT